MTGFGIGRALALGQTIEVQLATVNHRSCQISIRGDIRDVALEDQLRKTIRDRLQRGSINVQISTQQDEADEQLNIEPLRALWVSLNQLAEDIQAPTPRLESLFSQLPRRAPVVDQDALHQAVRSAAEQAIDACCTVRQREGQATAEDLRQRATHLRSVYEAMCERAPLRLEPWREALRARVEEAIGEQLDSEVIARECAVQADRIDVSEEMTRLQAHLERLDDLLDQKTDEPQGRSLEFLVQELGREVNTTGSKSNDSELTALVLEAKNILEQIREQAANIL